jgi:hypothetical protein
VDSLQEILAAPKVQHFSASALYLNDNVCLASIVDPDGHVLVLEEKALPPSFSAGMVMNTERGRRQGLSLSRLDKAGDRPGPWLTVMSFKQFFYA